MLTNVTGGAKGAMRAFGQFTPGQKAVTIAALLGIVFGGYFLNRWASTPTMVPLYAGLSASDASAVVDELSSSGVAYKLSDGGSTISVPAAAANDARLKVAAAGLPSDESSDAYSLVDKGGVTQSKDVQNLNMRRGLEKSLASNVSSIDGVQTAVVNLAVPEKDVFSKETDKTTASVLVGMAPGKQLSNAQVTAVTNLVASSVPGLAPEDVVVSDSSGQVLSDGTAGGSDTKDTETASYEQRVSSSLQSMLDKVVGPGHAVVSLTADLDYDQTTLQSKTYTGQATTPPISSSETTEAYNGSGANAASGVLGPDNINVPSGAGATASPNSYSKVSKTVNNAINETIEQRKKAPGTVNKLNVAVLLDTTTAGKINPADVTSLVSSAVGIDPKRGDTLQVTRMPFDNSAAAQAKKELAAAAAANATETRNKLIKNVGLGVLVFAVLVFALLSGRRKKKVGSLSEEERLQIEQLQRSLELDGARRSQLENGPQAIAALEAAPKDPHADLVALARSEIGELVEAQPQEVAQLLRGWLADRRG